MFVYGDASQNAILGILYYTGIFIFMIHLMNMLIAIMGNTYTVRNEVIEELKYKDHLRFVLDNWFLLPYAFKDITKVQYVIGGFSLVTPENEASYELNNKVNSDVANLKKVIFLNHEINMKKLTNTDMTVNNMQKLEELETDLKQGYRDLLKKKPE